MAKASETFQRASYRIAWSVPFTACACCALTLLAGLFGCDAAPSQPPAAAGAGSTGSAPPLPSAAPGAAAPPPAVAPSASVAPAPVAGSSSEQDVRSAMLALVDAERQLRRSIQHVSNGATAQSALPDLESGCRKVIDAALAYRRQVQAATKDVPLLQIRVDFNQKIHDLGKEFPKSAIEKMDNIEVAQVWGNSSLFLEMNKTISENTEAFQAKLVELNLAPAPVAIPKPDFTKSPADLAAGASGTPGVPPGFPVTPPKVSPPNPDERPPLDSPPRKGLVLVMRGPDGKWTPVSVLEARADGRVDVLVMKVANGQLVPGEKKTVEVKELRRALPQQDLPGL